MECIGMEFVTYADNLTGEDTINQTMKWVMVSWTC